MYQSQYIKVNKLEIYGLPSVKYNLLIRVSVIQIRVSSLAYHSNRRKGILYGHDPYSVSFLWCVVVEVLLGAFWCGFRTEHAARLQIRGSGGEEPLTTIEKDVCHLRARHRQKLQIGHMHKIHLIC
jgi:hypothetical protein